MTWSHTGSGPNWPRAGGSTDDEVASYAQRLRGAYESPEGPVMVLHRQAQDMLYNRPARQPAEILEAAGQVGRGAVSDSASQLMSQMIVATPQLVPAVQGRMPQLPAWSAARVSGVTRGSRHSAASLTVGSQGVMLTPEEGHHVTVRFDATAALLLWNDEQRTLIGTDGFAVRLDPSEWPDGDAVVRSVDALVPPGLTVAIDGPGPERPRRDQAPAAAATPADADAPRARPGVWRRIVRGLCFAVVAFGVLAITGGDVSGGIAFVVIGGLGLAWQLLSSQRRIRHRGS